MQARSGKKQTSSTRKGALVQNKNNKRKNNRNGNPRVSLNKRPVLRLSTCAAAYARALLDPFGTPTSELPCIPDLLDIPSYRFCTLMRGTFAAGSTGYGAILCAGFANTNDAEKLWATTSAYGASTIPMGVGTGVVGHLDYQFPYKSIDARPARSVAIAIRVRYIGTTLKQSGRILTVTENGGGNADLGGINFGDLASRPDVGIFPVTRSWVTVAARPAYPEAFSYRSDHYSLGADTSVNGTLAICIADTEAGNAFEYEVIQYYELISKGPLTVPNTNRSHNDPVGFGVVKDFLSSQRVQEVGSRTWNLFLDFAKNGAAAAATSYFGAPTASVPLLEYL